MKKFLVVLSVILAIAGIGGTGYFFYQYSKTKGEKEVLVQQNAQLQSNIDAIGPVTTAYTVAAEVKCGNVIQDSDFVEVTMPVSSITDNTILDKTSIVGMLYKIDITPGTTITSDMVMSNEFDETIYQQDMAFDYLPLGLKVGDYVDIRMTFPYGETFIVLTHKRIEQLVQETSVVKMYLTPAQQAIWTSALRDSALYKENGLSLYLTKYVEPGVQDSTVAYYPVRQEMEGVVTLNPNIKNKKECINDALRKQIDLMLNIVTEDDKSALTAGVQTEASAIKNSVTQYIEDTGNSSESNNAGNTSTEVTEDTQLDTSFNLDETEVTDSLQTLDSSLETLPDEPVIN